MRTRSAHGLWSDAGYPRFRRDPFARDVALDLGGTTMPRTAALHMLHSTISTVSAPASSSFRGSLPHPTHPLCTLRVRRHRRLTQHSLPGGLLGLTWAGLAPADRASFAWRLRRGRDTSHLAPPAQIRTCSFPAYGSYLGCVTAKVAVHVPAPLTREPGSASSACFAGAHSPWPPPFAPPTPLRPPPQTPPQGAFFALFAGFIAVGSEEACSIALALASVRRPNWTCSFPASSFHEDAVL